MNCENARSRVVDLIYGELTTDIANAVEAHLASCDLCNGEYEAISIAKSALEKSSSHESPIDVRRFYRRTAVKAAARARYWRVAASIAVVFGLLSFGLSVSDLTISIESGRIIASWSDTGAPVDTTRASMMHRDEPIVTVERIKLLESREVRFLSQIDLWRSDLHQLLKLLASRIESNQQRQERIEDLSDKIARSILVADRHFDQIESDLRALYVSHFP